MSKSASTVRQRVKTYSNTISTTNFLEKKYDYRKNHRPLQASHFFAILGLIIAVLIAVIVVEKQLPPGLKIADAHKHPNRFIAERAYIHLKKLTDLGPRICGSYANEVLAVELLRTEIEDIIANAKDNNLIRLDIQKASGAFALEFLDGMTNVYRNVQNVVVKVGSRINSPHSLLVNCHFDSVADSPGASDDGAGCAVMLEMLRVISQADQILRHNIIFLFNGGEENFLPASHGFITQHKWAKEVRAFINLEACGAGGREVLFQAGPNHPWILETYSEEVPYPYASSLAQEIFQSGIIPGDTDYRIFRDFGNISGLDFAWSSNGYVYHTKFDTIDQIPLGTLQRTGDNILALARGMAQGYQLDDVKRHRAGNLVFFDILGAFVLRWSMAMSDFINLLAVIFSLYSIYQNMKDANNIHMLAKNVYIRKLTQCMGAVLSTWIVPVVVALVIAFGLNALGRTMSWYARPVWLFFLYMVPTLLTAMALQLLHARYYHKDITLSPWLVFQLYYDAYQFIWTVVLFIGIVARIRSSFIPLLWVFFPALCSVIKSKLFYNWRDKRRILLHIGVLGLAFVQSVYLLFGALYLFIPIMGRIGAGSNSELLIAVMISFLSALLMSFVTPIVLLVRGMERIFSFLLGLFLLSVAVLLLTPLGFPYSGEPSSLAPQRFMIAHVQRTYHNAEGAVSNDASGYWIVDLDVNSPHTVDRHVPEMTRAELVVDDCKNHLYCGLPYLVPVQTFIWKTHWIPGASPKLPVPVKLAVLNREEISDGERITVIAEGPTHIGVMLSPSLGLQLKSWSLVDGTPLAGPRWNGRDTYFIYYAYAIDPVPLVFSMDFKIPTEHIGPVMDIAVTSHYLFGDAQSSAQFDQLLRQFPNWTAVNAWTASYESWII